MAIVYGRRALALSLHFTLALVAFAVGELAATGVACGVVLRRGGWFDPGLIHSSAESLH